MTSPAQRAAPRVEAALKVRGEARYPAETRVEGLLHAALVVAPIASGRVRGIDCIEARNFPGVVGIVTHENAIRATRPGYLVLLQEPVIHFAGQPVAVVVAETLRQARLAAAAVRVDYDELPAVTAMAQALDRAFAPSSAGRTATDSLRGEPERGLAQADMVLARRYTTPTHNHLPIEPQCVIAAWCGDDLIVNTTTQAVFSHREMLAACFSIPVERVRVTSRYLGGSFGAKGSSWFACLLLGAMVARHFDRPIKLELTRAQMFTLVGRRQETIQELKLGAMRDGRLIAITHHSVGQTSTHGDYADPLATPSRMLYACAHVATSHRLVRVNAPQPNPMRAPGEGPGSFALESAMDELAFELKIDPLELRLRNFADRDQHGGRPWSSNSLRECYRIAADAFGWEKRVREIGAWRDGHYLIGWGMASACYPVYRLASEAATRIERDGSVTVRCGTQDMGSGTYTALAQLAAETLGVPLERVAVELGDTRLPQGPASGGSQATASFAPAVEAAALALRSRLIELAVGDPRSPLNGHSPSAVTIRDGYVRSTTGNRSGALTELLSLTASSGIETKARTAPDAKPPTSSSSYGAVFVEVRVDPELGEIRLSRITAAYAAGRILNPMLARSQYVGGLIFGIGMALHEHAVMDESLGRIVNDNLSDYLLPVHADMPSFDIHLVDEDDPHLASGIKGIGMLGTVGVAAAIANAVFHATGRRIRDLPIRLEQLVEPADNA
jgi:xanthine dehydrogenase YagR molybdenum-binding subunit